MSAVTGFSLFQFPKLLFTILEYFSYFVERSTALRYMMKYDAWVYKNNIDYTLSSLIIFYQKNFGLQPAQTYVCVVGRWWRSLLSPLHLHWSIHYYICNSASKSFASYKIWWQVHWHLSFNCLFSSLRMVISIPFHARSYVFW